MNKPYTLYRYKVRGFFCGTELPASLPRVDPWFPMIALVFFLWSDLVSLQKLPGMQGFRFKLSIMYPHNLSYVSDQEH